MTEPKSEYTVAEMRELEKEIASQRRSKYNSEKVELDGHTFDSKAEARRYGELRLLEKAREITGIRVHPRWMLQPSFTDKDGKLHRAMHYIADFYYWENGHLVIEDVKGTKTAVFRIKEKLFRYRYPALTLRILEV